MALFSTLVGRFQSIALMPVLICGAALHAEAQPLTLWYERPAAQWVEALPVGNGRLGAMVFGGIEQERLQLNEDTLWAGGPYNPANPAARAALPSIRKHLAAGDYQTAQDLVQAQFMGQPMRQMSYQTLGDLIVTTAGGDTARDYRRELDLDTAVARTAFHLGTVAHDREVFSSAADQVIVMRWTVRETERPDRPAQLSLTVGFQSPQASTVSSEPSGVLVLRGVNGGAHGIAGVAPLRGPRARHRRWRHRQRQRRTAARPRRLGRDDRDRAGDELPTLRRRER